MNAITRNLLLLAVIVSTQLLSCNDAGTGPGERRINLVFRYGVGARNELNTFNDTFTKDLILDGTTTTRMVLSNAEFDTIEARFRGIGILTYPDTFGVAHTDTVVLITPYATYTLTVEMDGGRKTLYWEDSIISGDTSGANLRGTFRAIQALIEATPEYKALPRARGGYL